MFWRTLCAFALLASTAAAQPDPPSEIVVRDGDYYETLRDTGHPVRITGGRIDNLLGFGRSVTIEGGSIGTIRSGGNLELYLRGGGFQIDNPVLYDDGPMGDSDAIFVYLEDVYTFQKSPGDTGQRTFSAWFSDFTYGEVTFADNPLTPGNDEPIDFPTFVDRYPGDIQGDGVVDLLDINIVRNRFGDGETALDYLNAVRNNFGVDYRPGANPVPEPATLTLLLAGMTALCLAKSWRCNASRGARRSLAQSS